MISTGILTITRLLPHVLEMTAFIYAAPALLLVIGLFRCWSRATLGEKWSWGWGIFAIWACYLSAGALLVLGGCKRIAHVRLEGVEMDMAEQNEGERMLSVGAATSTAQVGKVPQPAIEVKGYPVDAFRIKPGGKSLKIEAGSSWRPGLLVRSGGRLVSVDGLPRLVPLLDGDEIVLENAVKVEPPALGGAEKPAADPLVGRMIWNDGSLSWKGEARTTRIVVRGGAPITAGGGMADDLFIQGLAPGALELEANDGKLLMRNVGKVPGVPQEWIGEEGKALKIGGNDSPWAGRLGMVKARQLEAPPPAADPAGEESAETTEPEAAKVWEILCRWDTAAETRWELPRRKVILPVVNKEVEVLTHQKWTDRVFPLSALGGGKSRFTSCVVYGAPGLDGNKPGLLILDKGVTVMRGGKAVAMAAGEDGLLAQNEMLEFLEIKAQARRMDGQAGSSVENRAVETLRRVGMVSLAMADSGGTRPVLHIGFAKPEVKAVPLGEIKRDLKENHDKEAKVAFGVNERHEFATLPHQVKFSRLWPWFSRATGEVEMHWLGLTVQDDYRRQELKFGDTFTIGGKDRLCLRVEKMGVPWKTLVWVATAMVAATLAALPWVASPAGTGLFFGVSFLTCSRGLFGHAILVNAPYDPQVAEMAWKVAVLLPLLLSALWWLAGRIKQGAPGRLLDWWTQRGVIFYALAATILLGARLLLLLLGFKEGIPLGGARLALSVVFVPLYLLLHAVILVRLQEAIEGGSLRRIWQILAALFWVFACGMFAGLAVSDLGSFLYLIPAMLVLVVFAWKGALKGLSDGSEVMQGWRAMGKWFGTCAALTLPTLALIVLLMWPKAVVRLVASDLDSKIASNEEIVTDSTLLRILHSADENYLINLGTDASEAILQDHAIMRNYAERGLDGSGFLGVRVIPAKQVTGMNDNVSSVYLLGQFGFFGALAASVAYLAIVLAGTGWKGRENMVSFLSAGTFAIVSLYMLAANAGVLPFTGRNMYLWGLNSLGDVLESLVLLGLLVFSLPPAFQATSHLPRLEPPSDPS